MSDADDFLAALRRLITATRGVELDTVDLADATAAIGGLADVLEGGQVEGMRMQAGLTIEAVAERLENADGTRLERAFADGIGGFFPYSPYVGPLNPIAPPVGLQVEPGEPWADVVGTHVFDDIYNGPPGGVHGGVISGVFDEVLGSVCVVNDVAGFTGTLTVRYRSLTPLGAPITMRGRVDRVEGRKTFASGTFHHGDTLTAEAEGIFIGMNEEAPGPP